MRQRYELGILAVILLSVSFICFPGLVWSHEATHPANSIGAFCVGFVAAIFCFASINSFENYRDETVRWASIVQTALASVVWLKAYCSFPT